MDTDQENKNDSQSPNLNKKSSGGFSSIIDELGRAAGTAAQGLADIAKQFTSSASESYHANRSTPDIHSDSINQENTGEVQLKRPKFCFECGAKLSETSKFCPECGKKID